MSSFSTLSKKLGKEFAHAYTTSAQMKKPWRQLLVMVVIGIWEAIEAYRHHNTSEIVASLVIWVGLGIFLYLSDPSSRSEEEPLIKK